MSGSVIKNRKGLRPNKAKTASVSGPQQGSGSKVIGTNVKATSATPWLKK